MTTGPLGAIERALVKDDELRRAYYGTDGWDDPRKVRLNLFAGAVDQLRWIEEQGRPIVPAALRIILALSRLNEVHASAAMDRANREIPSYVIQLDDVRRAAVWPNEPEPQPAWRRVLAWAHTFRWAGRRTVR